MPIYEFKCIQCGDIQEFILGAGNDSEEVEMKCKACGCETLERVISRVGCCKTGQQGAKPQVSSQTCGSGNTCATIDLPGPSR
jgi:putative FmdB family regulatory protein